MICKSINDTIPTFYTDDPLHDADWYFVLVEIRALLDMQFKKTRQSTFWYTCVCEVRWILAVSTQPISQS